MEVLCINKSAVKHPTNRSFIKAQQVCFPPAAQNLYKRSQRFQRRSPELPADTSNLLAKILPLLPGKKITQDPVQWVLAPEPQFRDFSS